MIKKNVLALAVLGITVASCGGKDEKKIKTEDTKPKIEIQKVGELKIAYYDQDSMKANFDYYKEQDAIVTKKQIAFQKSMEAKSRQFEADYTSFMKDYQAGLLSADEATAKDAKLKRLQEEAQMFQQTEGARIEKETMEKLDVISKKIDGFGKKYCEEHGIDILMIYVKGGPFTYISDKMDVTKEFTAYLNQNQEEIEKQVKKK